VAEAVREKGGQAAVMSLHERMRSVVREMRREKR